MIVVIISKDIPVKWRSGLQATHRGTNDWRRIGKYQEPCSYGFLLFPAINYADLSEGIEVAG